MPPRRARASLSSQGGGADDISHLSLSEVRSRLARNTAILSSSLFSPASPSLPTSPTLATPTPAQPAPDAARDKLVAARDALLAREQELLMEAMHISPSVDGNVKLEHQQPHLDANGSYGESSTTAAAAAAAQGRRASADAISPRGFRSGKQRALEVIRQGEGKLAPGGLILPIDQTLSLSQRDYTNQTAYQLSQLQLNMNMALNHTRSSSPKPRLASLDRHPENAISAGSASASGKGKGKGKGRGEAGLNRHLYPYVGGDIGGDDEISRASRMARLNAFMSYKGEDDDFDDEDDDDDDDVDDDDDDDQEMGGGRFGYPPSARARIEEINGSDDRNFPLAATADGGYDGNGLPDLPDRRVDAIGEEVDEFGEDDEVFAEGNDEYDLDGREREAEADGVANLDR